MFSELKYPFKEVVPKKSLKNKIKDIFGYDFGNFSRIFVALRFRSGDGTWTDPVEMYFDTGASISLIPMSLCKELGITKYVEHEMSGVVKKEECKLPVKFSKLEVMLEDSYGNTSKPFNIWTACSEYEEVPLLFGIKDFLKIFDIRTSNKEECLYLMQRF